MSLESSQGLSDPSSHKTRFHGYTGLYLKADLAQHKPYFNSPPHLHLVSELHGSQRDPLGCAITHCVFTSRHPTASINGGLVVNTNGYYARACQVFETGEHEPAPALTSPAAAGAALFAIYPPSFAEREQPPAGGFQLCELSVPPVLFSSGPVFVAMQPFYHRSGQPPKPE
jgi:hypothetical protein